MAQFDITAAASNAYRTVWRERRYLLRLAAFPFLVKLACFVIASRFLQTGDDYLRFSLIMVPALLAEGWMLAHFVRLLVVGHRWPYRASGDLETDMGMLRQRARLILSGMIVFTLIKMAVGFMSAVASGYFSAYLPVEGVQPEIPAPVALLSFLMLGFMFWGFRLLWLFIAYALDIPPREYLRKLKGLSTSLHMIGVWLICMMPVFLLFKLIGGFLVGIMQAAAGDALADFAGVIVAALAKTITSLLITAGITYGLAEMFGRKELPVKRR